MSSYPPPPPGGYSGPGLGRRIDAVIPQVRSESICAMRSVADTLRNLADRFEAPKGPRAG